MPHENSKNAPAYLWNRSVYLNVVCDQEVSYRYGKPDLTTNKEESRDNEWSCFTEGNIQRRTTRSWMLALQHLQQTDMAILQYQKYFAELCHPNLWIRLSMHPRRDEARLCARIALIVITMGEVYRMQRNSTFGMVHCAFQMSLTSSSNVRTWLYTKACFLGY